MTLERHPDVIGRDLPTIYGFIARENVEAAEAVLAAIGRSFSRLREEPRCGVRYKSGTSKLDGIRMLPVSGYENYLVFYRVESEVVRILYVLHGAQHLRRVFRREPRG